MGLGGVKTLKTDTKESATALAAASDEQLLRWHIERGRAEGFIGVLRSANWSIGITVNCGGRCEGLIFTTATTWTCSKKGYCGSTAMRISSVVMVRPYQRG